MSDWVLEDDRGPSYAGPLERLSSATSETETRERWQEIDIFRSPDGLYVAHVRGCSRNPGEQTFRRVHRAETAFGLIDKLIVMRRGERFLSVPTRRALADAASRDADLATAYAHLTEARMTR